MKRKSRKIPYLILVISISILLCVGFYFLVDIVWNGSFVDWFEWNFMQTRNAYLPEAGQEAIIHEPMWWKVKRLVLGTFIGTIVGGIIIGFIVSHFHAKAEKRKSITGISQMLRDYIGRADEGSDVFPQEYAEIAVQMAEIRTAMLRSEQALRNEAAQKNDLVTYLAHDLKTPLTSVIGYLSLLDEAPDMPPEQKEKYTHIALDKANRLERLVNEFFEITRYNLQQITLEQEQIDLYYMLVQMVDEFYPILSAKGNTAVLHANEDLSVCGDPMKLARVFNNILKNAAAYSFPNSEIIISAEKKDKQMVISFENQGPTIPEEKLSMIFERFYRMDEARSSNAGGAGLGLAIAKEIVTLHHGTITAESHENATVFTVSLPLSN
nr:HAMP domain-containing sensor histidine kinase [Flintibacter muris]